MSEKDNYIMPGLRIVELALFFEKEKILVLGDLQLGIEESMAEKGMQIPKFNLKKIKARLLKIFRETGNVNEVIINGDVKHEFGRISKQEWSEVFELIEFLLTRTKKITVVKGNHDVNLEPVLRFHKLKVQDSYFSGKSGAYVLHGDKLPDLKSEEFRKAKFLVIGHEHPAVTLSEGMKNEKFKCFMRGEYEGKKLIVLPSFTESAVGSDILQEQLLSPFLSYDLSEFEVWLFEDHAYYFGKVRDLVKLND